MRSYSKGWEGGEEKAKGENGLLAFSNPEARLELTPERGGTCLFSLRHPDLGRGKLYWPNVWSC